MTIIESGILSGIPSGAIIGGVICRAHGILGVVGGSIAGMVSGAVAGFIYSLLIMVLLPVVAVFWRAALKRPQTLPEADMELLSRTGIRGVFLGILAAFVCWCTFDWFYALLVAFAAAAATALIGVARCELR